MARTILGIILLAAGWVVTVKCCLYISTVHYSEIIYIEMIGNVADWQVELL